MRSQHSATLARIAVVARETQESLTAAQVGMYTRTIETILQIARLSSEIEGSEQSHDRDSIARQMRRIRADCADAIEAIYRIAASSPESRLAHVRAAQSSLLRECCETLFPQRPEA